jgi:hypothetical protein
VAAGGTIANVIRTRIMLTDISKWRDAARAHGELFRDVRPAFDPRVDIMGREKGLTIGSGNSRKLLH